MVFGDDDRAALHGDDRSRWCFGATSETTNDGSLGKVGHRTIIWVGLGKTPRLLRGEKIVALRGDGRSLAWDGLGCDDKCEYCVLTGSRNVTMIGSLAGMPGLPRDELATVAVLVRQVDVELIIDIKPRSMLVRTSIRLIGGLR